MALTFRGGVHIDENKHTRRAQVEKMPPPAKVTIPMSQHIGAPCVPLVKPNDIVDRGQIIGDVKSGLGCPVHASISGRVMEICEITVPSGQRTAAVVIENDGEMRLSPEAAPFKRRLTDVSSEEIIDIVRRAGISGMGGATFPTYAKIQSAVGKATRMFINCAECEPYITANHRLLLENPASVINGAKILLKALSLRSGTIAVEDNKADAIEKLEGLLGDSELLRVSTLKTKYPQGDERQLIYALTGIELPAGKLPADVGCVIFNAETCSAVFNAFASGMPLIERIVTVDGDCVRTPKNVLVPIGASMSDVIEFCGGLKKKPKKLISGGPMMGMAQWDPNAPVSKGTSAILVFSESACRVYDQPPVCIHCGKCVAACQMRLMPTLLATYAAAGRLDLCEEYDALSCVECGACTYICPGRLPITQYIRTAKAKIVEEKKAMAQARAASKADAAPQTEAAPKPETDSKAEVDSKPSDSDSKKSDVKGDEKT